MFEKELEFLEKKFRQAEEPKEIGNSVYLPGADGDFEFIRADYSAPSVTGVGSLDMLVSLIFNEFFNIEGSIGGGKTVDRLYIDIESPTQVKAFTNLYKDIQNSDYHRTTLYVASERSFSNLPVNQYLDFDEARIALHAHFMDTEDRAYVLDLLSRIVLGENSEITDNGVTQNVKVSSGVQLMEMEKVKAIVALKPYRTFMEVEQPDSEFLLRIKGARVGLFEADGGMWKLQAKKNIKSYLEKQFEDIEESIKPIIGI